MNEIQSGLTFKQAKELTDRAIQDVKNGIVVAGYALRAIRNEKLWKEHGYASFDTFMEICYQKDKSWASNCIRVYEQFGELAGPEQAPRLQERYQEYSAGGLIEMLSMPEKMREQVTADMPVREIRELKREARKVATSELETDPEGEQLEGQLEIYDFPEFMPEPEENLQEEPGWKKQEPAENNVINIMDLVDESAETDCLDEEPAAGRQPERASGSEMVQGQQENIEGELEERHWPKTCIAGWSKYGNCVCCGAGGVECCVSCEEPCNSRCGWIPEEESVQETKEPDEEPEILCKPTAKTLLGEYKGEWEALQAAFQDTPEEEQPPVVENTRIILQALQLLAEQERQEEAEPEEQPELPPMKNNDQRKEWLRNYQSWGLWYEDAHIGVRYYRYEFDNGAQLIAEEYPAAGKRDFTASYLHLVGGPEPPKHPSYGCPKWSRHERYAKHPDSETELVEFLKAAQR